MHCVPARRLASLAVVGVLATAPACDRGPTGITNISPQRIAFLSYSPDPYSHAIYIARVDGTGEGRLSAVPVGGTGMAWSRDGERIAFMQQHLGKGAIFIVTLDTPGQVIIAGPPPRIPVDSFVGYVAPAWSADGTRLAFTASRFGRHELMVVNADGTGLVHVAGGPGISFHGPVWSPDGSRLAVVTNATGSEYAIHLMNPDGTGITSLRVAGGNLAWSPDGREIAYQASANGNIDIYALELSGGGIRRLTDHPESDRDPAWSPGGSKLAFASTREVASRIYTMNADGTGVLRLPTEHWNNFEPVWEPPRARP